MRWSLRAVVFALAAVQAACGNPSKVRIVDEVSSDGKYTTRDVAVPTLKDIDAVEGTTARLLGETVLKMSVDFVPSDRGGSRSEIALGGGAVTANWVPAGDVAVPLDFDSLLMLSSYAHLERAAEHFAGLGVPADSTTQMPVYYEPRFSDDTSSVTTDNAAYLTSTDGFILYPNKYLQSIPLSLNPGVLAHEYSHRIWYFVTWRAQFFARVAAAPAEFRPSYNLSRGTDEGVADFFGAAISGDPNYVAGSLDAATAAERDLKQVRAVDASWVGGNAPTLDFLGNVYDPYALGAVVASTLWGAGEIIGLERVERAVLAAEDVVAGQLTTTYTFSLGDFETAVLQSLDPSDRAAACPRFALSYQVIWTRFSGVCP